eukprot:TRINITY_DN18502_c0_g1_i5.p1 TRINITY_DN18502_c0_g1~~TRINITY_DN18502_c0_g1_i5.p1  ORF type:complete len:522 (+),score=136.54 TRINITY_DN18502_c0_g1_i5:167-1732(+)
MIATVSPATSNREDSINTLRYALKAKSIVNTVRVNEQKVSIVASAMMREINELREQLQNDDNTNPEGASYMRAELEGLESEYNRMEEETKAAQQEQERKKRSIEEAARQAIEIEQEVQVLKQEGLEEKHIREKERVQRHETKVKIAKQKVDAAAMTNLDRAIELEREKFQHEEIQLTNMEIANRKEAFHKEMLVVKRKQFALAFQKAFKRDITHSSKHKMADELKATSNQINVAHQNFEVICEQLLSTKRQNEGIRSKIRTSEAQYAASEELKSAEDRALNDEVKEMQAVQVELDMDTQVLLNETKRIGSMHLSMAEKRAKDNHRNQESIKLARERLESIENERDLKLQLISQLTEQSRLMSLEIRELRATANVMDCEMLDSLRVKMSTKSENAELQKGNIKLQAQLDEHLSSIALKEVEVNKLREQSEELQSCQDCIHGDHFGLRHFVSGRFFPPGRDDQLNGASQPTPTRPQPYERSHRSASRTTSPNTRSGSVNKRSVSPVSRFHRFAPPIASCRERS